MADTMVADLTADMVALSPEESFAEAQHERLVWLIEHPVDLNTAGELELTGIPGVMPTDARQVIQWRSRAGSFSRIDQLLTHGPEGERLHALLAPFVVVLPSDRMDAHVRSRFTRRRVSAAEGEETAGISPGWREYQRITLGGGVVAGELTVMCEPWQSYGRAFISGNVAYNWEDGIIDRVILGDLGVGGSHGLVFGQAQGWTVGGRSTVWSGPMRIEPFHGSYGTRMVRGAAVTKAVRTIAGIFSLGAYVGRTPFIASLDESGCIRSLELRETDRPSASAKRATVQEWAAGARLAWNPTSGISVGASGSWARLGRPWADPGVYGREGGELVLGCDASAVIGSATISAEASAMKEGFAVDAGAWFRTSAHTAFSIAVWYYSPAFRNGKGGSGARGGDPVNDAGIALAASCVPLPGLTIAGKIIRYRRPWRTSTVAFPPSGTELMFKVTHKVSRVISLSGGMRSVQAESWESADHGPVLPSWGMMPGSRRTLSATVMCTFAHSLRFDTSIDHVAAQTDGRDGVGWLMSEEIHLPIASGVRAVLSWSSMATDGYDSRVYVLERDVAGAYSAPALSGTGFRWYVLLNAAVLRGMTLSARYAETHRATGPVLALHESSVTLQCDLDMRAMTSE